MSVKDSLNSDANELGQLIIGMRDAYARGENAMAFARQSLGSQVNSPVSALIAYDLQAGSYIADARENPKDRARWCKQVAGILDAYVEDNNSVLEVGCGEATTLAGVLQNLAGKSLRAHGFDISWSRCAYGKSWLNESSTRAELFVADLFQIPLNDSSIDYVYTSHSLEPNGGREHEAIKELLRVARRAVVLIEPIYELADSVAQARMRSHGYVRNLRNTAEQLGANVSEYRLLDYCANPLNPSGLVLLEKQASNLPEYDLETIWRCPLTHSPLVADNTGYFAPETGIVYPVLAGIPLLRFSHAVVASAFGTLAANQEIGE